MRRLPRLALLFALATISASLTGCREPTSPKGETPDASASVEVEKLIPLPDPLPLPDEPRAASWIAQPAAAVALVAPYSPMEIDLRLGVEQALGGVTEATLAAELAGAVDLEAPFSNVVLDDGQEVIRLSVAAEQRAALEARLAQLEAEGEFGGVRLPPPRAGGEAKGGDPTTWLAWVDAKDEGALVIANSLAGLVTGRELRGAYGKQPVFFSLDPSSLPISLPSQPSMGTDEIPFARVTGRGDLSALTIDAQAVDGSDPLAQLPIRAGTLGGMLGAPEMAAGISSRYSEYESTVRGITGEVNAQVRELPFLVKGVAQGLAAKFNAVLRSWDGRTLIAMGPNNHVRIAYGAHDVHKSRVAVIQLLQAVVDNVSIARNFLSQLPNLSFRRRVAKGDGQDIELFVVRNAARTMPPELQPLIADDGDLNVAMGWSHRVGGGMFVIGPNARAQLIRWLDETSEAPGGDETAQQLLAASFAAEPAQVRALLDAASRGQPLTPAQLLGLSSGGPPWSVIVTAQTPGRYQLRIERGPSSG